MRVITFQPHFSTLVRRGVKTQTMRKKARCKPGDKLSLRQHMRDEAIRLIKALTGATPADMDKIRCSGLSIDFCIEAAKTGLSAPEILKLGRTGVSLSNFLYMRRVLNASTEPAPGADHQPPQPAL